MTDPVRDALEAAVRAAASSGFTVPEQTVRARARRRRTTRLAVAGGLSLALLVGSGAAVLALSEPLQPEPVPPATTRVSVDAVCGWDGANVAPFPLVPLSSTSSELTARAGAHVPFPVNLRNNRGSALALAEGSAPVLVATASEEDPTVVGLAYLDHAPEARELAAGSAASFSSFGPFLACPGAPTADDGVHLAPGSYPLHAGQDLGWEASPDVAPFNTWGLLGTLELTDGEPAVPLPTDTPSPGTASAVGSCGWSGQVHGALTDAMHFTVSPRDLVSVNAAAPEVEVQQVNGTSRDLVSPAAGGPVLVVMVDRTVVALSRTTDPVPPSDLAAGESVTYRGFEPLVHCETGEPLPPGSYEFHVGRFRPDTTSAANRLVDTMTPARTLVVTDRTDVERRLAQWPTMPVCGDTVPEEPVAADALRTTVRDFDVIEVEGSGDTGGGGAGPDNTVMTLTAVLAGPPVEHEGLRESRRHHVLLRDRVVIGTTQHDFGDYGYEREPGTFEQDLLTIRFDDCSATDPHTPLVLDGELTFYGYVLYEIANPIGVSDDLLITVGHTFEHHPPTP